MSYEKFDPARLGDRSRVAWDAGLAALDDGGWHLWSDVVEVMVGAAGVVPKTASNLLLSAVGIGVLERRGKHPDRFVRRALPE